MMRYVLRKRNKMTSAILFATGHQSIAVKLPKKDILRKQFWNFAMNISHLKFRRFFTVIKLFRQVERSSHRFYVPKCETTDREVVKVVKELDDHIARSRQLFVITGAGISTESGIRDYRSEGVGLYAITDTRPIQYTDFLKSAANRKRYWARNYVGWPEFSTTEPNVGHFALAELEQLGKIHWLVTQNVDTLHTKASSQRLSELHGCSHR